MCDRAEIKGLSGSKRGNLNIFVQIDWADSAVNRRVRIWEKPISKLSQPIPYKSNEDRTAIW